MYIITKKSPETNNIYTVEVDSDTELLEHLSNCFKWTKEEVLSVLKV